MNEKQTVSNIGENTFRQKLRVLWSSSVRSPVKLFENRINKYICMNCECIFSETNFNSDFFL